MKIKDYKCKCEHDDFFFVDKGNQKGIYCSYCGKWYKWADKDEQNLSLRYDDAISRQAVLDQAVDYGSNTYLIPVNSVKTLPSVTPKEKTGEWIYKQGIFGVVYCSECDFELKINDTKYCPNCGARMVESKESEDKE